MPKETIDTTNKLIKPEDISPSDNEVIRQLSENLQDVTTEDINAMCDEIDKLKDKGCSRDNETKDLPDVPRLDESVRKKIYGKKITIFLNLEKNFIKVEEPVQFKGRMGKIVRIKLPAVGKFKGFNFDYYVTNEYELITKSEFEADEELCKHSCSMEDISLLLQALNQYMDELGVETDENVDYKNELRARETGYTGCTAGEYLKEIVGLDYRYWLKDSGNDTGGEEFRAIGDFFNENCHFNHSNVDILSAGMLIKLSK